MAQQGTALQYYEQIEDELKRLKEEQGNRYAPQTVSTQSDKYKVGRSGPTDTANLIPNIDPSQAGAMGDAGYSPARIDGGDASGGIWSSLPFGTKGKEIADKIGLGPIATAAALGIGLAAYGKKIWGGKKEIGQKRRDEVRSALRERGLLDDKWQLTLSDGSTFDFGKDGGATLSNLDGTTRKYKDIDWNNQLAAESVADANPLGFLLTGLAGKKDTSSEITGYITNAITANAKDRAGVDANIKSLYNSAGYKNRQQAYSDIDLLTSNGRITNDAANAFKASINKYLPDEAGEQPTQRSDYLELPPEKKMDRKRINSRFDTGFTSRTPIANDKSTGVNAYLNMLNQMNRGRNG